MPITKQSCGVPFRAGHLWLVSCGSCESTTRCPRFTPISRRLGTLLAASVVHVTGWEPNTSGGIRPARINTGMRHKRGLTDEQWKILDPLIPKPRRRRDGRGRPWKSRRSVLNGVLWVLRNGAPWADLPDRYASFQTCHRRFQQWVRSRVMTRIMTALARELSIRGAIDTREAFIDASFAPAKKWGSKVGKTKRGKGTKIIAAGDRNRSRFLRAGTRRGRHPFQI
jgi:transposase